MYNDPNAASQAQFAYLNAVNAADTMLQKYGSSLGTETDPTVVLNALNDALTLAKEAQGVAGNTAL